MSYAHLNQDERYQIQHLQRGVAFANGHLSVSDARLLPLDHQQVSQARVVKGICDDRHGPLPSLLPSSDKSFSLVRKMEGFEGRQLW
ncbi:hypothetical protein FBQ98_13720 [Gammaproteobacteria bacterium PRO6]|nr:hypothetical protein [Gammaproteobacteria bacterium PRO6]